MGIEIRPPAEDELRAAMNAAEIAFGSGGIEDEDWERESKALPAARALAAFDGGKPVALAGAYEFASDDPGRPAARAPASPGSASCRPTGGGASCAT